MGKAQKEGRAISLHPPDIGKPQLWSCLRFHAATSASRGSIAELNPAYRGRARSAMEAFNATGDPSALKQTSGRTSRRGIILF